MCLYEGQMAEKNLERPRQVVGLNSLSVAQECVGVSLSSQLVCEMAPLSHLLFLGNFLPFGCGISAGSGPLAHKGGWQCKKSP